jgi:hypothetical protein
MEAIISSETLVALYQTKHGHVSQDTNLYSDHNENIQSNMFRTFKPLVLIWRARDSSSSRTMALGSTQPLTKINIRNLSGR